MTRAVALLVLLLAACRDITAPVEEPASGQLFSQLDYYSSGPTIEVPRVVQQGVPFSVKFVTYRGGCAGPTENVVRVNGSDVFIYSYQTDLRQTTQGCLDLDILFLDEQIVPVTLNTAGNATIRVFGRREPGNTRVVFTRRLQVGR